MRLSALLILAACSHAAPTTPPTNTTPGTDKVTLAVVMSGMEIWAGNDKDPQVANDAPERMPGALDRVTAAFAKAAPSAPGLLVTYADKATLRAQLGPPLAPAAFGAQPQYHSQTGNELAKGLALAADQLEAAPAGKRYLIVLGDGNDTNNDAAKPELAKLAERFAKAHVEVTAIVYRTQFSPQGDIIDALTPKVTRAPTLDAFETALVATLQTVH